MSDNEKEPVQQFDDEEVIDTVYETKETNNCIITGRLF